MVFVLVFGMDVADDGGRLKGGESTFYENYSIPSGDC